MSGSGDVAGAILQAASASRVPVLAVIPALGHEQESELAWRLLGAGVRDVLSWSETESLGAAIEDRLDRWAQADGILDSPLVGENLIGRSAGWRRLLEEVVDIALFSSASLLITGETGTGKELLARLVHTLDRRRGKGSLVTLDCTTVMPDLSGSEFFGHERGSYTGAHAPREGAFALAHGGTLFLDEVGELPLAMQAQLLRVIQEKTYKPVGGNEWRSSEFRLICATNRDLEREKAEGRFRTDFYHRVAVCRIHVPPLRERREDILPLARHFLGKELDPNPGFSETVAGLLRSREYPGNVRELRQLVRHVAARHAGPGPISPGDVPAAERPGVLGRGSTEPDLEAAIRASVLRGARLKDIGRTAEEIAERVAFEQEDGNVQRAADRLGVTSRALQMRRAARRGNGASATA
ncbi:MAG: sigma-54-dependent Fis family transcriptional regulator [Bryobacterales bacterium]|nr:sigma-54-dependent Fis family transcriptional regulator [Bryobacterales bacterium]